MYGAVVAAIGEVVAQAAPSSGAADLAPWASVLGSGAAVGGIVYIAQLMATGKLVARDPARVEAERATEIKQLAEIVAEAIKREDRLFAELTRRNPS